MREHQFSFIRCSTSSYMSNQFLEQEQSMVHDLKGQWINLASSGLALIDALQQSSQPTILLTNTHTQFSAAEYAVIDQKVALIIHPNSGRDNFDSHWLQNLKIPLVSGHSIRAAAVSDYILAHALFFTTPPLKQQQWDTSREWQRPLISTQHFFILGLGHIGKRVRDSLQALGAKVSAFDPQHAPDPSPFNHLGAFDGIIVAAELNTSTHQLLNESFFQQLKAEAWVINAARGEIVHWPSLIAFLQKSSRARAAIDVFPSEPWDFAPWKNFIERKQLILSSHQAGCFDNLLPHSLDFTKRILTEWLASPSTFSAGVHRL